MSWGEFNHACDYERLYLLAEELGEAVQAVGKVLRHGYASCNPDSSAQVSNQQSLEGELGDVAAAIELLVLAGDLDRDSIDAAKDQKLRRVGKYLHHGRNEQLAKALLP